MSRDDFNAAVLASQEQIRASINTQTAVFQSTMHAFMSALWKASLLNAAIVIVCMALIAAIAGVSVLLKATPDGLTLQTPREVLNAIDNP